MSVVMLIYWYIGLSFNNINISDINENKISVRVVTGINIGVVSTCISNTVFLVLV